MTEGQPTAVKAATALAECGVSCIFYLANAELGGLIQHCGQVGIRVIPCRDERSASFMAASYGALTRRPGVCVLPQGPGVTNALTGLAQAEKGAWPVLSLAARGLQAQRGRGGLQDFDVAAMLRPVSKWVEEIATGRRIDQLIQRALRIAASPRRGHAHLAISQDALDESVCGGSSLNRRTAMRLPKSYPAMHDVRAALACIAKAERPVLFLGPGAWFSGVQNQTMSRFLERLPIPTFTMDEARGILPDSHFACLGSIAFGMNGAVMYVRDADLILTIGLEADWRLAAAWPPPAARNVAVIRIESYATALYDEGLADVTILADEALGLDALTAESTASGTFVKWPEWLRQLQRARETWIDGVRRINPGIGVHPVRIVEVIETMMHRYDANVVIDGGHIGKWAKALLSAQRPGQVNRLKGAWAAIGHGIASGIVRKLTDAKRPVIVITGDGSAGYSFLELETSITQELPIVVVVAVDGAWGSVRTSQLARFGGDMGTVLPRTRFDLLAMALGARGAWVTTADELESKLIDAMESGESSVIAVESESVASPAHYPRDGSYAECLRPEISSRLEV